MSDESSAEVRNARSDWMKEHISMYLRSGGAEGHIMDLVPVGGYAFATHCLIKYRGRKSGKIFITPLCYTVVAGEVVIIASKGGADSHPAWYLNICESDEVEFQIATEAFRGTWREPEGAEREKVWNIMAESFPFYNDYKAATDRVIPVVMMKAVERIDVFKESDPTGSRQL